MFAQPILVTVFLALGASAQRFGCGTADPSAEHVGMSKVLAAQEARQDFNLTERATVNVGVYVHVVASAQTAAGGWVTVSFSPS